MTQQSRLMCLAGGQPGLILLALLVGCTGNIAQGEAPGGPDLMRPSAGGDGVGPEYTRPAGCDTGAVPAHVVMHRLNRLEYNNTIRDLLGDNSRPADEFPVDYGSGGFDNNASVLTLDPTLFAQYEGAALRLAQKAVAKSGFISCNPATAEDAACAKKVLEPLARRAWRRPVTADEMTRLATLVQTAKSNTNTFQQSIVLAVQAILLSPNFLFRVEYPPSLPVSKPYSLDAYAIASRLSYFLWSTMPDEPLFAAAASGKLLDPQEITAQVTRMLADDRAATLADNLAGGWLLGRMVAEAAPLVTKYPNYDPDLRASAPQEPTMLMNAFIQENRDLRGLLDADFTFVNQRLARHYGITGVAFKGNDLQRVPLANNAQRRGVLTQASFLIATSNPDEPGISRRGHTVLSSLLCTEPPPPPGDALAQQKALEQTLPQNPTRRDKAYARDAKMVCGGCHNQFDPIGLGLDKYDVIGAWREKDDNQPIVIRETWNGMMFTGPIPMVKMIADDQRLPGCVTRALFRYALGRGTTDGDQCFLESITKDAIGNGFRARDLVSALATSASFRFQVE